MDIKGLFVGEKVTSATARRTYVFKCSQDGFKTRKFMVETWYYGTGSSETSEIRSYAERLRIMNSEGGWETIFDNSLQLGMPEFIDRHMDDVDERMDDVTGAFKVFIESVYYPSN